MTDWRKYVALHAVSHTRPSQALTLLDVKQSPNVDVTLVYVQYMRAARRIGGIEAVRKVEFFFCCHVEAAGVFL